MCIFLYFLFWLLSVKSILAVEILVDFFFYLSSLLFAVLLALLPPTLLLICSDSWDFCFRSFLSWWEVNCLWSFDSFILFFFSRWHLQFCNLLPFCVYAFYFILLNLCVCIYFTIVLIKKKKAFTLPLWLQLHSSLVLIYFSLLLVEISAFDFGYIADSELRILPGLLACFILQHSALFLVLSKLVEQVWHKSNFGSVSTLSPTCGEIYTL